LYFAFLARFTRSRQLHHLFLSAPGTIEWHI